MENSIFTFPTADSQPWLENCISIHRFPILDSQLLTENTVSHLRSVESVDEKPVFMKPTEKPTERARGLYFLEEKKIPMEVDLTGVVQGQPHISFHV